MLVGNSFTNPRCRNNTPFQQQQQKAHEEQQQPPQPSEKGETNSSTIQKQSKGLTTTLINNNSHENDDGNNDPVVKLVESIVSKENEEEPEISILATTVTDDEEDDIPIIVNKLKIQYEKEILELKEVYRTETYNLQNLVAEEQSKLTNYKQETEEIMNDFKESYMDLESQLSTMQQRNERLQEENEKLQQQKENACFQLQSSHSESIQTQQQQRQQQADLDISLTHANHILKELLLSQRNKKRKEEEKLEDDELISLALTMLMATIETTNSNEKEIPIDYNLIRKILLEDNMNTNNAVPHNNTISIPTEEQKEDEDHSIKTNNNSQTLLRQEQKKFAMYKQETDEIIKEFKDSYLELESQLTCLNKEKKELEQQLRTANNNSDNEQFEYYKRKEEKLTKERNNFEQHLISTQFKLLQCQRDMESLKEEKELEINAIHEDHQTLVKQLKGEHFKEKSELLDQLNNNNELYTYLQDLYSIIEPILQQEQPSIHNTTNNMDTGTNNMLLDIYTKIEVIYNDFHHNTVQQQNLESELKKLQEEYNYYQIYTNEQIQQTDEKYKKEKSEMESIIEYMNLEYEQQRNIQEFLNNEKNELVMQLEQVHTNNISKYNTILENFNTEIQLLFNTNAFDNNNDNNNIVDSDNLNGDSVDNDCNNIHYTINQQFKKLNNQYFVIIDQLKLQINSLSALETIEEEQKEEEISELLETPTLISVYEDNKNHYDESIVTTSTTEFESKVEGEAEAAAVAVNDDDKGDSNEIHDDNESSSLLLSSLISSLREQLKQQYVKGKKEFESNMMFYKSLNEIFETLVQKDFQLAIDKQQKQLGISRNNASKNNNTNINFNDNENDNYQHQEVAVVIVEEDDEEEENNSQDVQPNGLEITLQNERIKFEEKIMNIKEEKNALESRFEYLQLNYDNLHNELKELKQMRSIEEEKLKGQHHQNYDEKENDECNCHNMHRRQQQKTSPEEDRGEFVTTSHDGHSTQVFNEQSGGEEKEKEKEKDDDEEEKEEEEKENESRDNHDSGYQLEHPKTKRLLPYNNKRKQITSGQCWTDIFVRLQTIQCKLDEAKKDEFHTMVLEVVEAHERANRGEDNHNHNSYIPDTAFDNIDNNGLEKNSFISHSADNKQVIKSVDTIATTQASHSENDNNNEHILSSIPSRRVSIKIQKLKDQRTKKMKELEDLFASAKNLHHG